VDERREGKRRERRERREWEKRGRMHSEYQT
jgi:hypothetical protein